MAARKSDRRKDSEPRDSEPGNSEARDVKVVERGDIFFLYRPKVETEHPEGEEDVQRFHVVLRPEGGGKIRLLTIGRKRLPDVQEHERAWGFVDKVAGSVEEITDEFRDQVYQTKTRGERHRPAARLAGHGVYALVRDGRQLFLAYELDLPATGGEVQKELNIAPRASFALSIRNPERAAPPGVGRHQEPYYPKRLQDEFRGRRFATEDARFLDYAGAEFVLVGAREDPESELGVALEGDRRVPDVTEILRQFRLERGDVPVKPLVEGTWR